MQPLKQLNNVQKARLLHALFLEKIPQFLQFVKAYCEELDANPQFTDLWDNDLFNYDFWLGLKDETQRRLKRYGRDLERSSAAFADQLFDGFSAMFLNHCLYLYTKEQKHTDPKFITAVTLFFLRNDN